MCVPARSVPEIDRIAPSGPTELVRHCRQAPGAGFSASPGINVTGCRKAGMVTSLVKNVHLKCASAPTDRTVQGMVSSMKSETQTSGLRTPDAGQSQHNRSEVTCLSIAQAAQLSGVSEADLLELVACGALVPVIPDTEPRIFDINCVLRVQRAARVRQDLALDSHGFAMVLVLFNQITRLEAPLRHTLCEQDHSCSLDAACTSQPR